MSPTDGTLKPPFAARVDPAALTEFCLRALISAGLSEADARLTAELQVGADMRGIYTHGTIGMRRFVQLMRDGGIDPRAVPETTAEGPAWAQLDAHQAIGMVGAHAGMTAAIDKARNTGIGTAGVRNSNHFGAACMYALMAMDQGMIGVATSNVDPVMSIPGGRGPVIGNNPLSYAVPTRTQPPIVLDIAMSTVAGGKVHSAHSLGKPIPEGWLTDAEGMPTTDPSGLNRGSALTPLGGHKGYGLALLVESLASVLAGASITSDILSWSTESSRPCGEGHWFMAIDVGAMMPADEFLDRSDELVRRMRSVPRASGAERTLVPGEIEQESEAVCRELGVALTQQTVDNHTALADDLGLRDLLPW